MLTKRLTVARIQRPRLPPRQAIPLLPLAIPRDHTMAAALIPIAMAELTKELQKAHHIKGALTATQIPITSMAGTRAPIKPVIPM